MGPSGNSRLQAQIKIPSLKKNFDYQNGPKNEAKEPVKLKSMWANKFFRNPNRKPFPWGLQISNVEEEEHIKEFMEEGIQMREEDMDYLQ